MMFEYQNRKKILKLYPIHDAHKIRANKPPTNAHCIYSVDPGWDYAHASPYLVSNETITHWAGFEGASAVVHSKPPPLCHCHLANNGDSPCCDTRTAMADSDKKLATCVSDFVLCCTCFYVFVYIQTLCFVLWFDSLNIHNLIMIHWANFMRQFKLDYVNPIIRVALFLIIRKRHRDTDRTKFDCN